MNVNILFNEEAKTKIMDGVNAVANAVKITLGAGGRTVAIQTSGSPHLTKDGVTVAKSISFSDEAKNIGASVIKDVASRTATSSGDGTTTASILAQYLIIKGIGQIKTDANPVKLRKGIEDAVKIVIADIKKQSKEIEHDSEMVKFVASVSANNDLEIGNLIHKAISQIGKDGLLRMDVSKTGETYVDIAMGLSCSNGYISPNFITEPTQQLCEYKNCLVLVCNETISHFKEQLYKVVGIMAERKQPLLIIAEDVDGDALSTALHNKMKGVLPIVCVRAPYGGARRNEFLQDVATYSGAKFINKELGLQVQNFEPSWLGEVEMATVYKDKTTLVALEKNEEAIKTLVKELREQPENEWTKERIAKLTGGVAVIRVGGATDTECKEKADRIEDAAWATTCALQEGIVAGGGVCLLRASQALEKVKYEGDEETGRKIVLNAIQEPLKQLLVNAGLSNAIIENIKSYKDDYGYNIKSGQYEHLLETGIIDPAKVVRLALENASSAACVLLTTEAIIINDTNNGN